MSAIVTCLTRQVKFFCVTDPQWLTAEQERAWRRYRRMRTVLDLAISRDLRRDSSLSEADYDVLSTLSEGDEAWRAGDLAARLMWSTSRLAHQVGRMEQRGLLVRSADPDDNRAVTLSLSDHGRAVLEQAAPPHVESVRANFIGLLTDADVGALDRIASTVLARLRPGDVPE